jgi:hypothetical protein
MRTIPRKFITTGTKPLAITIRDNSPARTKLKILINSNAIVPASRCMIES